MKKSYVRDHFRRIMENLLLWVIFFSFIELLLDLLFHGGGNAPKSVVAILIAIFLICFSKKQYLDYLIDNGYTIRQYVFEVDIEREGDDIEESRSIIKKFIVKNNKDIIEFSGTISNARDAVAVFERNGG